MFIHFPANVLFAFAIGKLKEAVWRNHNSGEINIQESSANSRLRMESVVIDLDIEKILQQNSLTTEATMRGVGFGPAHVFNGG